MPNIKSVLEAGIKALPEDFKIKGQSLPNQLKRMGVKDEEIKFSGVLDDLDPKGSYSKQNLEDLVKGRKDKFSEVPTDNNYVKYSPKYEGEYTETVLTSKASDFTSEHFPMVDGYVSHARYIDEADNRLLFEVQRDFKYKDPAKIHEHNELALEGEVEIERVKNELVDSIRKFTTKLADSDALKVYFEGDLSVDDWMYNLMNYRPSEALDLAKSGDEDYIDFILEATGESNPDRAIAKFEKAYNESGFPDVQKYYDALDNLTMEYPAAYNAEVVHNVPFKDTWVNKTLERQILDAQQAGKSTLTIFKTGGKELQRGDKAQKTYEELIIPTTRKLAKKLGLTTRDTVRPNGEQVLELDIPRDKAFNFTLYSSPVVGITGAYQALRDGYKEQELHDHLVQSGVDSETANELIKQAKQAQLAVADGYSEEEVFAMLQDKNPETVAETKEPGFMDWLASKFESPKQRAKEEIDTAAERFRDFDIDKEFRKNFPETAAEQDRTIYKLTGNKQNYAEAAKFLMEGQAVSPEEYLARLKIVAPNTSSILTRGKGYFGDEKSFKLARELEEQSANNIIQIAAKNGLNLVWQRDEKNQPGLIDQMSGAGKFYAQQPDGSYKELDEGFWNSVKAEGSEITGGIIGGVEGAKAAAQLPISHPFLKGLVITGASVAGAATGAVIGSQFDYLEESVRLQEEMSMDFAAARAMNAGQASVVGDLVALSAIKSVGKVWKGAQRVWNYLADGNSEAGRQAMKEYFFITDEEAAQKVAQMQELLAEPLPSGARGQIGANVLSRPGAEGMIKEAIYSDPQAGAGVAKVIDDRAKDVIKAVDELKGDNVGRLVTDELDAYVTSVQNYYGAVKAIASDVPETKFSFSIDTTALSKVLESVQGEVSDVTKQMQFAANLNRINNLTADRSFGSLIELRQVVNDFKFNKGVKRPKDFEVINGVLDNIDALIEKGAEQLPNGKQWLTEWAKARAKYAEMARVRENVMYKALTKDGVTPEQVVKSMSKYINSLDGTFSEVMDKLPAKLRARTEGAVIGNYLEKFTSGAEQQAIYFPGLAEELNKINFINQDARNMVKAITKLADVFKNDVQLAAVTGRFEVPKFTSYLTSNPATRAEFAIASKAFRGIRKFGFTKESKNIALVETIADFLENPLKAKTIKQLTEEFGNEDISKLVLEVQQGNAKKSSARVLFSENKGQLLVDKNGSVAIPLHRIATYNIMEEVAKRHSIDINNAKALEQALKEEGYLAIQQGTESARRIK